MGDIATHKEIVLHMIPQLNQISPAENYTYIEFGNFLTDISQFRDPVSFLNAKKLVTAGGFIGHPLLCQQLSGFLGSGNLFGWADAVFGKATPEDKRHGKLAEFFRLLCRAVAHIRFSADSTHREHDLTPLSATEVDRVFDAAFTQYYPHEHVDYPPPGQARNPDRLPAYKASSRGLLKYLERHTQFISEELSKIEYDMAPEPGPSRGRSGAVRSAGAAGARPPHGRRFLLPFQRGGTAAVAADGETASGQRSGQARGLSLPGRPHPRRQRPRRHQRTAPPSARPSSPVPKFADDSEPPPLIGDRRLVTRLAVDFAYTGGFGSTDISHTIAGGLSALEESMQLNSPLALALFQQSELPLLQVLFSETERNAIAASCQSLQDKLTVHTTQLNDLTYPIVFAAAEASGDLTAEARAAFVAAWALDGEVATQFPGKPGPGGFLLLWLRKAQKEVNDSHAASDGLDADTDSPYDLSSTTVRRVSWSARIR